MENYIWGVGGGGGGIPAVLGTQLVGRLPVEIHTGSSTCVTVWILWGCCSRRSRFLDGRVEPFSERIELLSLQAFVDIVPHIFTVSAKTVWRWNAMIEVNPVSRGFGMRRSHTRGDSYRM